VLFETVSPKEVYLGRLAVLPAWRGKGIARSLIGFVEDEARRHGAQTLSLGVRIALPAHHELFAACGFRETSRNAHPGFSEPTSIRMEKPLKARR
jgi:GNAT superfamily N-acetyltransferase